jgi:hypothetical protein
MSSPIVETVRGVDIWKEGDKYGIYDGMVEIEEYDSLGAARLGAIEYANSRTL